jgi:RNA polymerase sigma factor (sigma-70 family)
MPDDKDHPPHAGGRRFATTHWSMVLEARHATTPASRDALARLCETYWYPLYAYVRRWGHQADDAADLTQEFFARLLEKEYLRDVDPARGRFRSFLLAAMKHFLLNERDRANAARRGGGVAPLSLEFETAEGRYRIEPPDRLTPDKAFERQWARTVLERTMDRLRREQEEAGKLPAFGRLQGALTGETDMAYAEIGAALGMSEGAVKVAVHRLRRRFGELLRQEIAETIADPAEVDDEIRYLFAALEP